MGWVRALGAALLLLVCGPLSAALANTWHRAESPHFIIYAEGKPEEARTMAAELERFRAGLILLTGAKQAAAAAGPKLTVYRLARSSDLRLLMPGARNVAGFYRADETGVRAFSLEDEDSILSERAILQHEYAHHFMMQYFPGFYPAWYVEGFAEYVATAKMRDGRLMFGDFDPVRVSWLRYESWMPLERLITAERRKMSQTDIGRFYAKSWLTTHFMFATSERQVMLRAYINSVRGGADPTAAFEAAFKAKPSTVDDQILRYVRGRVPAIYVTVAPFDPATIAVTPLGATAGRALLLKEAIRLHRGTDGEALRGAELRTAVAALPGDAAGLDARVEMEARIGDPNAALAQLAQVSNAADAGLWEGVARLRRALALSGPALTEEMRLARRALVAAQKAYPDRGEILFRYLQTFVDAAEAPNPALIGVARRLNELAPQSLNSAIAVAMVLSRAGAGEEAANLMAPFAANPHGNMAEIAESLQDFLRGGGTLTPDARVWGLTPLPVPRPAPAPAAN